MFSFVPPPPSVVVIIDDNIGVSERESQAVAQPGGRPNRLTKANKNKTKVRYTEVTAADRKQENTLLEEEDVDRENGDDGGRKLSGYSMRGKSRYVQISEIKGALFYKKFTHSHEQVCGIQPGILLRKHMGKKL